MVAGLDASQTHHAQEIIAAVRAYKGFTSDDQRKRAADIALATALTESNLRNYANGNNPASMRHPHDAVGWDHGSVGLFQQQVGGAANSTANWGTTNELMDPKVSANKFLRALAAKNWKGRTNWDLAQSVQGSFDPSGGNYRRNDSKAIAIRKALWGAAPKPAPKPPAKPPSPKPPSHGVIGTYRVQRGDTLTGIAKRYPQKNVTADSIAKLNKISNPNKIFPGQSLLIG